MAQNLNKKAMGRFNFDTIGNVILAVIGVVILFSVIASLFPTLVKNKIATSYSNV